MGGHKKYHADPFDTNHDGMVICKHAPGLSLNMALRLMQFRNMKTG